MVEPMVVVTDPWHLFEERPVIQVPVETFGNKDMEESYELNIRVIEEVKAHRCIWDIADPDYNRKNALHYAWLEIASNLGNTVTIIKNRWKNLRSRLRTRMYKAIHSGTKTTLAHFLTTWVYLPYMLFIIEQRINSNFKPNSSAVTSFEDIYLNDYFNDNEEMESGGDVEVELVEKEEPANSRSKKRQRVSDSESKEVLETNEKSLGDYQKEVETKLDPDYLFFTSLLPSLKKLPEVNKQEFLMKIQELIFEEYMKSDLVNS